MSSTRGAALIALSLSVSALAFLAAGAATRALPVVVIGYAILWFGVMRARRLLRRIDTGEAAADGRGFAALAWGLGMAGSGLAILAFAITLLG